MNPVVAENEIALASLHESHVEHESLASAGHRLDYVAVDVHGVNPVNATSGDETSCLKMGSGKPDVVEHESDERKP